MGVNEEQSLEDLVLHAMAEESAAQKEAEQKPIDPPEGEGSDAEVKAGRGPVIDLSKDDDIVLSNFDDAADDILGDALSEAGDKSSQTDEDTFDEDELLSQLASIEDDDSFDGLDGFGEQPDKSSSDEKKT